MKPPLATLLVALAAVLPGGVLQGEERVDFARDVHPLLQRYCFECHSERKQEGGLRLDSRTAAFESQTIQAGAPADSELLRRVRLPEEDEERMPAVGDRLSAAEIETLRRWIEQGALWPEDFRPPVHWAYVPPSRPAPPPPNALPAPHQAVNAIDSFVQRRLQEQGFTGPSPAAEPAALVRRLYLDVLGLPPSPEEAAEFLRDPSDAAYARLVDRLLQRPQFGEKWARPWLDLARYADSHGFQRDDLRDIWAYRDWVIRAFNADMPFDQFTVEQIAGDLLPEATESQRIATGFHRCAPTNVEAGSLPEETRVEQVLDRVNTTAAVWLGTTLECAQCHDHKYDPFTMRDYYGLLAYFNSTELEADRSDPKTPSSIRFLGPSMPLADSELDSRRKAAEAEQAALQQLLAERRTLLDADLEAWAAQTSAGWEDAAPSQVLRVRHLESEGGTDEFRVLEDGAVLLVGDDPPAVDEYRVEATVESLRGIRAFRLDALRHESLPGGGPGRGDQQRTNFVLHEFTAAIRQPDGTEIPLPFRSASADFSQKNWDVGGAVDGDPKTGWAISPQFDRSHWAEFELERPLNAEGDLQLVFRLSQRWGAARTLGCFRLTAVTGPADSETPPERIVKLLRRASQWQGQQRRQALDWRVSGDAESQKLTASLNRVGKRLEELQPATTLVMVEKAEPRPTRIFLRGDYRNPGESVGPATPAALHALPAGPPNRLSLARWLVSPDNPLTARVVVNRWWAEIFGRGIVATVEDFGVKGEPPTHPDLLDWLAVEFVDSGWSMKHVLRTIFLSGVYRQSSRLDPVLLERDDVNRWLARGPGLRLDAEAIRDQALAASGLLSRKQFGEPVRPYQPAGIWKKVGGVQYDYQTSPGENAYRRGVYVVLKRGAPYPSFVNFDATARLACTVQRSRTNTPLQALTLLNDPVYVEAAQALALRAWRERPRGGDRERLELMFRLCLVRAPSRQELLILERLLDQPQTPDSEQQSRAARLLAGTDLPPRVSAVEFAGWFRVASTLLNLHETITKP